ncbi:RNA polymerase II transcriptional coactivator KIWI-like [Zingiber officinale]|uniref:RNA polymerase II transcriptional coactivator KIWI-like n=1 Tax=Zingiber officinale TaxID=94328 RepID=UPI001C4CFFA5|nr:RNA polymerase II transcriptional coactivator KIWI-like [Zingiber officinale]
MWKKGWKRKTDDDFVGKHEAPHSRKFPKRDSDEGGVVDGIAVCQISKNRKVSVRQWQGKVVVDIREFYAKDGKDLPGKKGISLPMDQWKVLLEHVDEIDAAVEENS